MQYRNPKVLLRGTPFSPVFQSSGTTNFFGEGYPFHWPLKWFGLLDFAGSTFVAKTTTLEPRTGNMPLVRIGDHWYPREIKPQCIYIDRRKRLALNAVSLSGPGAKALLDTGLWHARTEPFMISFMSFEPTMMQRLVELNHFLWLIYKQRRPFNTQFGLQINFSCPNVPHHEHQQWQEVCKEARLSLELCATVMPTMPVVLKYDISLPIPVAKQISDDEYCDALVISNTIKFGALPELINWRELFDTDVSPLAKYGGGGLSGAPLLKPVTNWVWRARSAGITKPIIAGGGILDKWDALSLSDAGRGTFAGNTRCNPVALGSVAFLAPMQVQKIIRCLNSWYM